MEAYLGIINVKMSSFFQKMSGDVNGRRFARVTSVFLESKSKHGDVLICNCVEHDLDNTLTKTRFLIFVHINDLFQKARLLIPHSTTNWLEMSWYLLPVISNIL